jgi:transcription-repair coupling factor (superfamily II helicase)
MSLYRRLSDLKEKNDIEAFAAEMIDRFGKLPDEVENLLQIIEIKQLCRLAGVDRFDAGPKGAVIGFRRDVPPNITGLIKWMGDKKGIRLRPDQKLVVERPWEDVKHRVTGARSLMKELSALPA